MVLLLTMMISKSIQNQSLQPPCEVSIWTSLLQMGKLRCREIRIPHTIPWPLSARAKNKTWVCQTPKLIVLQQRHGTESKPRENEQTDAILLQFQKKTSCVHLVGDTPEGHCQCGKHGALGHLNYGGTGAWVAGTRTQGGTEIGGCANYRSSRKKKVLPGCKEWKKLEYPKQSMKGLTQ